MGSKSLHFLHMVQLYQPVPSGAARYFIEIGSRLVAEGHRVTVLATDAFDLEYLWSPHKRRVEAHEDVYQGVRVLRFPVRRIPGPPIVYPLLRRAMVELSRLPGTTALLRRMALLTPRQPELYSFLRTAPELADVALVHTTNITLDFGILPLAAWTTQRGIPHISTPFVHLGEPGDPKLVRYYSMRHQIALLRCCAAVLTMTSLERNFLRSKGVPDELMRTVGVGVTPEELAGGDGVRFRHEHGIEGPIVLSLGVAAHDKGTIHVVEALRRLWAQGVDATWVQIGPQLGHFEQFYQQLPAAERARTRVLGFAPDQTKRDALAAANLLAMPSRTDSFGIVYMEAWCYGIPVVGARAGGVPDVIADGRDGLLVRFGDVPALAEALGRLLRDPAFAKQLGSAGHDKVLRQMTWAHTYGQVREVYEQLVSSESLRL